MAFDSAPQRAIEPGQVAVSVSRGRFGAHVGLVFTDAQKVIRVVHLAWHKSVKVDVFPDPERCWIATIPDLPPTTAKTFVGVLRKIAKRQPHIPYGINVLAAFGSFSDSGDYRAPKGSDGLTCATFVSELFRAIGAKLVIETTWPEGVNTDWANGVVELLKETGASEEHVAAVQANLNGIRIRPEELGAAADLPYKDWAVKYEAADPGSAAVLANLNLKCPLLENGGKVH